VAVFEPETDHFLQQNHRAELLIDTVLKLSDAKSIDEIAKTVRTSARQLVNADGATFVLRQNDECFYADEDAVSPLWKGKSFPLEKCISGWTMLNHQQVSIPDIYMDSRIPHDAYRPTFVKSLLMTPVRKYDPIAAIGTYWSQEFEASPADKKLLQTLADTTAVALSNVMIINDLENRVKERTSQLELINSELQAFAYRVSHDLKGPLRGVERLAKIIDVSDTDATQEALQLISNEAKHLAELTESLLDLSRLSERSITIKKCNISSIAVEIMSSLAKSNPDRLVQWTVAPDMMALGDLNLLYSLLLNLLGNAWKYTGKTEAAKVEMIELSHTANFITFAVRDNGAGFEMKHADKLFQPFQRLHAPHEFAGNGLGLATVKRILDRLGGSIKAQSQPGFLTEFIVTLPTG
jgi:K+-sensing histidine kinase KdpD